MKIDEAISLIKNTAFLGYNGDDDKMAEAIQTIEQLVGKTEQLEEAVGRMAIELAAVKKERDAAVAEWISVKDKSRRPKDGEQVWCYGSGYYFTAYYDEVQETDYGLNPFGFYELHIDSVSLGAEDEEYIESCATHWMPLPEPPEVEDGKT